MYCDDRGVEWSPHSWRLNTRYVHLVVRTGLCWFSTWLLALLVLVCVMYYGHVIQQTSGVGFLVSGD